MNSLNRKHQKPDGANKYHIDCNELEKNPSIIPIIIKNVIQNKNEMTILQSVINDKSITQNNRHIVVKIGKVNKTIEKEFNIGKKLENEKLTGFINYICLFNCYDNTYNNLKVDIEKNNNNIDPLCFAKKKEENLKTVLIMPYINEGSIKNFKWNKEKYDALKSVILQTIMSVFTAYQLCGFLHNDLHLDNILVKKTKKETFNYKFKNEKDKVIEINIKADGYKIVIMDFESSMINIKDKDGLEFYWKNLYNMVSRCNLDLKNEDDDDVSIFDLSIITYFIEKQKQSKGSIINTLILLDMIKDAKFIITKQIKSKPIYDPNIF
jgi:thiamine kinase-like enzyme